MISVSLNSVFREAVHFAKKNRHEYLTVEHIFLAILKSDEGKEILSNLGGYLAFMIIDIEKYLYEKSSTLKDNIDYDPYETVAVSKIMNNMIQYINKSGRREANIKDMLISIIDETSYSSSVLKEHGILKKDISKKSKKKLSLIKPKMVKIIHKKPKKTLKIKMIRVPLGKLTYQFEIGKYPVTFEEYDMFCEDTNREKPKDEGWGRGKRPVINVSWDDAMAFCEWLSKKSGDNYILPTELEWEYACRAGTDTQWSFGNDEKELDKYAWYDKNSNNKTHEIGEKKSNQWGLYDMHGNVCEWTYTTKGEDIKVIRRSSDIDKIDLSKIVRGGSYFFNANKTSSAYRDWNNPYILSYNFVGFRIIRTLS